jgi:hypothetical protein
MEKPVVDNLASALSYPITERFRTFFECQYLVSALTDKRLKVPLGRRICSDYFEHLRAGKPIQRQFGFKQWHWALQPADIKFLIC